MRPGEVVSERFVIERLAGSGGMGDVYRALDRTSGATVALKVLRAQSGPDAERFSREAQLLAELDHPGIVRYVAHGRTPEGVPHLAIEWLEGETLSSRLARGGLTVDETVTLGLRTATALAEAHRRGIVHRDLKPGNLFLVDGAIDRVKILDFGIARPSARSSLTLTGVMVGTPGYMAPEQARGERWIDARADVFALGCCLFKCLTGRAPFEGDDVLAVLLKVVLEEPPRTRELRDDVPPALDALVARMMAKVPDARPRDGAAVAEELSALGELVGGPPRCATPSIAPAITVVEQRMMTVVLARSEAIAGAAWGEGDEDALRAIARRHGGALDRLADGSVLVTFASGVTATDLAAGAVRCALAMRAALRDASVTVVSGTGIMGSCLPMGEVIDRGVALLAGAHAQGVRVDEVTAALLDARFQIDRGPAGLFVRGEHERVEAVRTLLGKPTSCVGRERELAMLEACFAACASDAAATAVLVTGGAGVGKSRLRHELLARLRNASPAPAVWVARGDPMRAGAPFGMLSQFVRRAASLLDGEPLPARQGKLAARVARSVEPPHRARVTEFLGEMVGTPFPEQASVQLRAARQDAMVMGDQMRRAWVDLLAAECAGGPLLLVLEDLHWGDLPTVEFVDTALRLLGDRPLMVLALARPDVREVFPVLWAERGVTELRLGELSRKACERLVRDVLGAGAPAETVAEIVERSAGNAFFLEELLRGAAEGRAGDVPKTVLAMVQSRLEALDAESRRVLRAGSVFGQVFWRGGVVALLGPEERGAPLDEWLARLERGEWIGRRPEARFRGEKEYVMRHALVREGVYGMLTDEDRRLGHRLAGAWLVEAGEPDAAVVAEHFERGEALDAAVDWYGRAAAQALEGNDLGMAIRHVERALACGAQGDTRGALCAVRAEAHRWRGEHAETVRWAAEAMQALRVGGPRWHAAAAELATSAGKLSHAEQLRATAEAILGVPPDDAATGAGVIAAARVLGCLCFAGDFDLAGALEARIEAAAEGFADDPMVVAWTSRARAVRARFAGDASGYRDLMETAVACAERAGAVRTASSYRVSAGFAYIELGGYARAAELLRGALGEAERMGLGTIAAAACDNLGVALARLGALDEARAVETRALEAFGAQGDQRAMGGSRIYLTTILRLAGDLAGAEAEARQAVDALAVAPPLLPQALATLAEVLLAKGCAGEALERAREAVRLVGTLEQVDEGEALARLVLAEALDKSGDRAAARAVIAEAHDRLLARARKIADPAWRASFLENVPEHARTVALARSWSVAPAGIAAG